MTVETAYVMYRDDAGMATALEVRVERDGTWWRADIKRVGEGERRHVSGCSEGPDLLTLARRLASEERAERESAPPRWLGDVLSTLDLRWMSDRD